MAECDSESLSESSLPPINLLSLLDIIALISMKFNCDDCCYAINLDSDLLTQCKKATGMSKKHHLVKCY